MTKEEVRKTLGDPYLYRASIGNQETWEYLVYDPYTNPWTGQAPYWVNFTDDTLVFFGHPGDYQSSIPSTQRHEIILKSE